MTPLADLVRTSRNVAGTPARLAKVRALAEQLRAFDPAEIEIGHVVSVRRHAAGPLRHRLCRAARGGGGRRGCASRR